MKKFILLPILLVLCIIISACGGYVNNLKTSDDEIVIVTSFYPMYIFTSNIAKDIPKVQVINMAETQTGCLHDYQLLPSDMKLLENADILVVNGAGMEPFMDKVINQLPEVNIIEATQGMELLMGGTQHHHDDEEDDHDHEEPNPHVWVSISGAIQQVKNITLELIKIDPTNGELYQSNGEDYTKRLENLKSEMHFELKNVKTRDIVTFHEAFPYFAEEFGLNVVAVVQNEPGSEQSAGELAETIRVINKSYAKVIFVEPQYSAKAAESIAKQTGAKIYLLDPIVTGPKDPPLNSYEVIMRENLKILSEALNEE